MTVRRSRPPDARRVLTIWRDAVDATHHFLSAEDRAAIEREVIAFLPEAPLWLAVDDEDRAVGFMLLDGAHMEALFVDPACHGCGIGRRLVAHAIALQGTITTDVNAQNAGAIGFYRRLGFAPVGRSELDGQGRAYPLLHMRREASV